jgi:hypothetical protein
MSSGTIAIPDPAFAWWRQMSWRDIRSGVFRPRQFPIIVAVSAIVSVVLVALTFSTPVLIVAPVLLGVASHVNRDIWRTQ